MLSPAPRQQGAGQSVADGSPGRGTGVGTPPRWPSEVAGADFPFFASPWRAVLVVVLTGMCDCGGLSQVTSRTWRGAPLLSDGLGAASGVGGRGVDPTTPSGPCSSWSSWSAEAGCSRRCASALGRPQPRGWGVRPGSPGQLLAGSCSSPRAWLSLGRTQF